MKAAAYRTGQVVASADPSKQMTVTSKANSMAASSNKRDSGTEKNAGKPVVAKKKKNNNAVNNSGRDTSLPKSVGKNKKLAMSQVNTNNTPSENAASRKEDSRKQKLTSSASVRNN